MKTKSTDYAFALRVENIVAIETYFRCYDFVKENKPVAGITWNVVAVHKLSELVIGITPESPIPSRLDSDYTGEF